MVGWVALDAETAPASVARLAAHPGLLGLRPMIQDIADHDWMLGAALAPGIAAMVEHDLTFDALVLPRHLSGLKTFLKTYPDLRVVIDHCAKPDIRNGAFDDWARDMADIAADERVFCKLSGLATEAAEDWSPDTLGPYIDHVTRVFGPDRLLFGSDWPVMRMATDYAAWRAIFGDRLGADVDRILKQTPLRAYPRLIGRVPPPGPLR